MTLMGAMIPMMDRTITCRIRHHHPRQPDPMAATLLPEDLVTFRHPPDPTLAMVDHDPRTRQLITPLRLGQGLLRLVTRLSDRIRMVPEGGRQMHM